jgi:cytochrome c553
MRRFLMVVVAGLIVCASGSAYAADADAGKKVFDGAKPACKMCHTDTKHSLAKVGTMAPGELRDWVRTPADKMKAAGKTGTMPAYTKEKMPDADLDNLVAYLGTMK